MQLRETASDLHAFLASLEAEPGRLEQLEGELELLSDLKRRHGAQTFAELLERGEEARRELAPLAEGHDPVRAAAEALAARRRTSTASMPSCGRRAGQAAEPFAAAVAAELQAIGLGDGEFQVVLSEREPGRGGRRRRRVPDPPERRAAVRAGRGDGVGRRALPGRPRDRGRGRRRDDGLRRDRRRHRRHDRACGRRDAAAAGRSRPGADDHPPAADRDRRRPALRGREGRRRPDPHPDRAARRRAAPRRARADARRGGLPRLDRPRCLSEARERELLAPREDVWRFLAEPYHLSDWWPGITGVEPDRRGFAPGARWKVQATKRNVFTGAASVETMLLVREIELYERWSLHVLEPKTRRRDPPPAPPRPTGRSSRVATSAAAAPTLAVQRLYDLVQTAARLSRSIQPMLRLRISRVTGAGALVGWSSVKLFTGRHA